MFCFLQFLAVCFLNVVQRTYVHVLVSMWLLQPGRLAVRTSGRRPRMQSDTFALQVDYRVCSCNRCSQLPHQQLPLYRAIQVHTHTAVVCGSCSSWRLTRRSFVVSSSRHSACVCVCVRAATPTAASPCHLDCVCVAWNLCCWHFAMRL